MVLATAKKAIHITVGVYGRWRVLVYTVLAKEEGVAVGVCSISGRGRGCGCVLY